MTTPLTRNARWRSTRYLELAVVLVGTLTFAALSARQPLAPTLKAQDEKISKIPKMENRRIQKPYAKAIFSKEKMWDEVPRLGFDYERGFMNSHVWKEVRKMQEEANLTWSAAQYTQDLETKLYGKPKTKVPIDEDYNRDEFDFVQKGSELLATLDAEQLFGLIHPFANFGRKLTTEECLKIIQNIYPVSFGLPAMSVLVYMRRHNIPRTNDHYAQVYFPAAHAARMDIIEQLEEWKRSEGFEMTDDEANLRVLALGLSNNYSNATKAFDALKTRKATLTIDSFNGLIGGCIKMQNLTGADVAVAEMEAAGFKPNQITRELLLHMYASTGRAERIEAMLLTRPADYDRNPYLWFSTLLIAHMKARSPEGVVQAWQQAVESGAGAGLRNSTRIYNLALELLGTLASETSEPFKLSTMLRTVWEAMNAGTNTRFEEAPDRAATKIDDVLKSIAGEPQLGYKNKPTLVGAPVRDAKSYEMYARGLLFLHLPVLAVRTLDEMAAVGLRPSPSCKQLITKADDALRLQRQQFRDMFFPPKGVDGPPPDSSGAPKALARLMLRDLVFYCEDGRMKEAIAAEIIAPLEEGGWESWEGLSPNTTYARLEKLFKDASGDEKLINPNMCSEAVRFLKLVRDDKNSLQDRVERIGADFKKALKEYESETGKRIEIPSFGDPSEQYLYDMLAPSTVRRGDGKDPTTLREAGPEGELRSTLNKARVRRKALRRKSWGKYKSGKERGISNRMIMPQ